MKLVAQGELALHHTVMSGDTCCLKIDGKVVHEVFITRHKYISHWALVETASGTGYFIGDHNLIPELEALCHARS